MDPHGRSILLTGGGSGIGRSLALLLADRQPRLTLVGRRVDPMEEVAALVRAQGGETLVVSAGVANFGDALRRELFGDGVHVLNIFPGATSTPMMDSSHAGPELGFDRESPDNVAAVILAAMVDGSITVIRGGETRSTMIALNRDDPEQLDRMLADRKTELEKAVAGHSSL